MTGRNLKFVRYADDFSVYCKSDSQARATSQALVKFLKTKLKLAINTEKSGIRKPVNFTILGFGFVPVYKKGSKNLISAGSGRKGMEETKRKTQKHYPKKTRESN